MAGIDYKKLYLLQDKVMDVIFEVEREFYLTGGTCLSRFYWEKRYSDDLDFFTNDSKRYYFAVKNIKIALQKQFSLTTELESKNFARYRVDDVLQLDFVNDVSYYHKEVVVSGNYLIDNVENILSNKLVTVIGRDDPKDIFDIYLISKYASFSWEDILKASHKKTVFDDSDLLVRLKTFPVELLKSINLVDKSFLNNFENEFPIIINEIAKRSFHKAFHSFEKLT